MSFGWVTSRIIKGYTSKDRFSPDHLASELGAYRHYDLNSFRSSVWRHHKIALIISFIIKLCSEFLTVEAINVMRTCTGKIKELKGDSFEDLVWLTLKLLAMQIVNTLCMNHQEYILLRIGLSCRRSLISQIYENTMKSELTTDEGRLINLLTMDVLRIGKMFEFLHYIWSAPFQSILIFYRMYKVIGKPAFIGISLMVLYVPIQLLSTNMLKTYRQVSFAV